MRECAQEVRNQQPDEELADVLIAISVIAKRLARKLQAEKMEGGNEDEQDE